MAAVMAILNFSKTKDVPKYMYVHVKYCSDWCSSDNDLTDESLTDGRKDGRTDGRTERRTDERTNGRAEAVPMPPPVYMFNIYDRGTINNFLFSVFTYILFYHTDNFLRNKITDNTHLIYSRLDSLYQL